VSPAQHWIVHNLDWYTVIVFLIGMLFGIFIGFELH